MRKKKPRHKETLTVSVTVEVTDDQAVESKCRMLLQWASTYDKEFTWSKEIIKNS
jgi:hypothetical protein